VLLQFFPGFDGKTSITLWIVQAKSSAMANYQQVFTISDPPAREIWVQNLKPYTKYKLRIIAKNIVGESAPSEPSREFETQQAAPGQPPGNVTVRALNATALRISWTVSGH
jgi:protein sidekick